MLLHSMLDSIIFDAIPGPEHLAMANSVTFSAAVSMVSKPST